jgi:hypothetical protein
LGAVALTRSLFHLAWLAGAIALAMVAIPGRRRATAGLAALPFTVVLALYTKNLLLFGTFSASSWFGLGLWQVASWHMPGAELVGLMEAGVLSPAASVRAFEGLDAYAPYLPPRDPSGIPALDRPRKADGLPNYNAAAYLDAASLQRHNALALIRARPGRYLRALARSATIYLVPTTDYPPLDENRSHIRALERVSDLLQGQILDDAPFGASRTIAPPGTSKRLLHIGLVLVVLIPTLVLGGAVFAWRQRRARPAAAATAAFAVYCVVYVSVVGNMAELSENNRFRFSVEPMLVVLGALAVQALLVRFGWVGRRAPEHDAVA